MSSFYAERRKDRAAEREQDRADRQAELEQQRKDAAAAKKEKERQDEQRRVRRAAFRTALSQNADTVLALIVMACAMLPAAVVQVWGMSHAGAPIVLAMGLAVMLEAGAWVATLTGERAKREGRPTAPHRIAMWGCAAIAAGLQIWKVPDLFPTAAWMAPVMAFASLAGVGFWELRSLGKHEDPTKPSPADRRAAKAESKAVDDQDAARKKQFPDAWARFEEILAGEARGELNREEAWAEARRSIAFPEVWTRYQELLVAVPLETRTRAEVWQAAWQSVNRLPVGETLMSLSLSAAAQREVEQIADQATTSPESLAVERLLADIFGPGDDGYGTPGGPAADGPQPGGQDGAGDARPAAPNGAPETRTPLGRKGMQGSGRTSSKTPDRPLAKADLTAVRRLARDLGGADKLSVKKIRSAGVGGADAYLMRLRDAVREGRA